MQIQRNILLNPGPATTTDSVKMAQLAPDICPREKEFGEVMADIAAALTRIAGGNEEYTTVLFGGSGTAAVEAIINSVIPPQRTLLVIDNGAYGRRMAQIAQTYGIAIEVLSFPWGEWPDVAAVQASLAADTDDKIAAVAMVHHETTTGMLNPVAAVGELAHQYGKIFIVDTISSFAGIPFQIDDLHIDFMASTSNKCIQGMAGCAFVIARQSALAASAKFPARSFYLDLYQQYDFFHRHYQMRFTPPVQILYALKQAISEFFAEGAENRYRRYCDNWQALVTGMTRLGFRKLLPDAQESRILTTFHYLDHPNFDFTVMHDRLYHKGFTIYPGKITQDTFRLANMGAITVADIEAFCQTMATVLQEMGIG